MTITSPRRIYFRKPEWSAPMSRFTYLNGEDTRHRISHDFICEDAVINSILVRLAIRESSHVDYVHANHEAHDTEDEEECRKGEHDRCED